MATTTHTTTQDNPVEEALDDAIRGAAESSERVRAAVSEAAAAVEVPETWKRWPLWARFAHVFFITNLIAQMGYAGFQVFVVLQPEGHVGPMFMAAQQLPFEQMMIRRMYAIEGWIAFGILSLYLGITELHPRTRSA